MMKPKLWVLLLTGLVSLGMLTGCVRNRVHSSGAQPAATETRPSTPTQAAALPTAINQQQQASPSVMPDSPVVQPTVTPPAAASEEDRQAANDLSNMLDDLTKDLNEADDLNDVK
jgi:hypothetical protein